jgi:hypothetical protein
VVIQNHQIMKNLKLIPKAWANCSGFFVGRVVEEREKNVWGNIV